jgi:hypothetical protein
MTPFQLNILSINNYGDNKDKAIAAAELFTRVFNDPGFSEMVINFTWNGNAQFANNIGLSNGQIFQKIQDGAEIASPVINNKADLNLTAYSRWWPFGSAIGYTDVAANIIYTKWFFISASSPAKLAGHYAHEYTHSLGFEHDYDVTPQRPFSVPYAIGNMVEQIATGY